MNTINKKQVLTILLTILILLGVHGTSYADVTAVSDRTSQVRDAIVAAVPNIDAASDVTETHLAAITRLNLRAKSITGLKSGDFSGLTGLTDLNLYGNQLSSLPNGIFEGLTALTTLRLGGNTVDPLPISVSLEKVGDNQFKAVAPTGASFAIVIPISAINGSIAGSATTLTIAKGSVQSDALTLTRTDGTTDAVTVDIGTLPSLPINHYGYTLSKPDTLPLEVIGAVEIDPGTPPVVPVEPPVDPPIDAAAAPVFTDGTIAIRAVAENTAADVNIGTAIAATDANSGDTLTWTLGGVDAAAFSIVSTTGQLKTKAALDYETKRVYAVTITVSDGSLTGTISVIISVIDKDDTVLDSSITRVSDRTAEVRDAIVAAVPGVTDAANVTATHLAAITSLVLRNAGISSLETGDFSGLTALTSLNLYGNMLSSLPSGIFEGLTALTSLRLGGNTVDPIPLIVSLQQVGVDQYQAVIPVGAPFDVVLPINGAGVSTMTVTISKGSSNSPSFTAMSEAIVSIGVLPTLPSNHFGYALSKSTVCNRTLQILEAITAAVPGVTDCRNLSEVQLATITSLGLSGSGITALHSDDFAGLLTLSSLDLSNNQLNSLPDGIFSGLAALTTLSLGGNTVDPIPLTVSLEKVGTNQIKAVIPTGAPFAMILPISVANGSLSGDVSSITIMQGSVESMAVTVLRASKTAGAVSADIGALPNLPAGHSGYALAKSDALPVEIFKNVNIAPVFTEGTSATRTIAERTAAGINIGSAVSATDANSGDTLTWTLGGTNGASFSIVSTSGQLQTKAALDYETKPSYTVTITVSDGGLLTDTITVTINITDVYENSAPVFTDGTSTTRSITENTVAGVNIGSAVSATDADDDTLTYTLGGTDAATFSIDDTSGQLQTKADLDYELDSSYTVTISVSDANGGTDSITVTINVTDIDEEIVITLEEIVITLDEENNAPVFTDGTSTTRSITENTVAGVNIGDPVSAADADDDTLTYTLGGTDAATFSIDDTSGQLQTKVDLDYELDSSYTVTISVSDANGGTDSITVTINVTDVDEEIVITLDEENNAPVFTDGDSTTRSITENTVAGVNIGDPVSATDADDDTLTYTLGGTDAATFSIDDTSGQLQTKNALNYEQRDTYSVTIAVSDANGGTDSITVTINVTDIDEEIVITLDEENNAPVFTDGTSTTRSIAERTEAGVNIGDPVSAADADDDTLTYTLGGTDAATFSIDDTSGQLQTKADLDYELDSSYTVTISVSDANGGTDSITVTINVTNVDENSAPVFTDGDSTTRSIAENTEAGVNIGDPVSATDADDDTLTWTLGGIDAATFSIDDTSGQLQTKVDLDYELDSSYTVTISVSDANGGTDSITVTINVTNVDENSAPVFTDGDSATRSIAENTEAGVNIGDPVSATDADDDTLTWTLGGIDAATFTIDDTSGQLQTKNALNYEQRDTYSVTVSVSDGNGGTDSIAVTINITNIAIEGSQQQMSNSAPVFTDGDSTTRSIAENTASGVNIGDPVSATDADDDTLTYTLGGIDAETFSIDDTSGQLQTKNALNYEQRDTYSVTIAVSDGNGGSDSIAVTINITNIAIEGPQQQMPNSAPVFTDGETATRSIAENTASGVNIGSPIAATDTNSGDTLTWTLGGTDASSFSIVGTSGQLQTSVELNYENKTSYTVTVSVSDGNGGTDIITVTINVTDVDEGTTITPVSDRTSQVQDAIVAAIDGVDNAADVTEDHLAAITELNFDSTITTLNSGDFDGLSSLSVLSLGFNELTSLPTDIFDGLSSLTDITLDDNSLTSLPDGIFDGLSSLIYLYLNSNDLTSLPAGIFDELSSLKDLSLNDNDLTSLSDGVFDGLSSLEKIKLVANTSLTSLSANVFDGLSSLELITMSRCGLTSLPDGIFDGLSSLKTITMSYNDLTSLPSEIENLTSLERLNLKGNPISDYGPLRTLKQNNPDIVIDLDLDNNPPMFTEGDSTTRSVAENTAAGQNIGSQVSATDADNDTLRYAINFSAYDHFIFNQRTGQLQTKAPLDYETQSSYTVYIYVYDRAENVYNGGSDVITVTINVTDIVGAAPAVQPSPDKTALLSNFPNPFNPETWIPYHLAKPSNVAITIYDVRGNVVRELDIGHQSAGFYTNRASAAHWDGRNESGERVANGIYFYQLQAGSVSFLRKMVILK